MIGARRTPANREDTELEEAMAREEEYIAVRREAGGRRVGLALSGGGIRSATFSLGILQALSRHGLLPRFDYLSTVSGGSYIGSFFGALYVPPEERGGKALSDDERDAFLRQPLQSLRGRKAVANLREFGRYLTPGGSSDTMFGIATIGRNWVMLQCVLGLIPLFLFLTMRLLQSPDTVAWLVNYFKLQDVLQILQLPEVRKNAHDVLKMLSAQEFSGLFMLATLAFGLMMLSAGLGYWYSRRESPPKNLLCRLGTNLPFVGALLGTGITGYSLAGPDWLGIVQWIVQYIPGKLGLIDAAVQLGTASKATFLANVVGFGCLVTDARSTCLSGEPPYAKLVVFFLLGWSVLLYLSALTRVRLSSRYGKLGPQVEEENVRGLLTRRQADLLLLTLALGAATLIDFFGGQLARSAIHFIGYFDEVTTEWNAGRTFGGLAMAWHNFWPFIVLPAPAILTVQAHNALRRGSGQGFLAKAGGQAAMGLSILFFWLVIVAAIARALGPGGEGQRSYLIAVWALTLLAIVVVSLCYGFLNQSSLVALYSDRLKRAYVGASNPAGTGGGFDIGREGDTVKMRAYYGADDPDNLAAHRPVHLINLTVAQTQPDGASRVVAYDRKGKPMHVSPAGLIHEQGGPGKSFVKQLDTAEQLSLSTWTAISGAAASTAIGGRTSLGLSILAMMTNVRLGYWWKTNVRPWYKARSLPDTVHGYLLSELQSNFVADDTRQRWYLTDGGHFENTGAYALIQRRLDVIVVCDNGADPDYRLDDVMRLVDRARSDLRAEIDFLSADELDARLGTGNPLRQYFGTYEELATPPPASEAERKGRAMPYAALARITYDIDLTPDAGKNGSRAGEPEPAREGLMILIKPRLNFSEPPELLAYRRREDGRDFPQQSTLDQFFDEEQWEAYRRFGEIVGDKLFVDIPGNWTPHAEVCDNG